ncbi:MAG: hypothetical protein RIQ78_863 [Bacteroidota bacterium]
MDLQKTKIYLDKLSREYARMAKDTDNIVRLDVDIMASYVRELYDAILSAETTLPIKYDQEPIPRKAPPVPPVEAPVSVVPPRAVPFVPQVEVLPPTPLQEETPVAPPVPAPSVVVPQAPPPIQPMLHKTEPMQGGLEILFEEKKAKELSEKLSELPIQDLKKAIALNDRLLLTSELFAGDGKAFESAIGGINGFSTFEEAQAFLVEYFVVRYAWTDKKRVETAKNFIKLVRRRFK